MSDSNPHGDSLFCGNAIWPSFSKIANSKSYSRVFVLTDSNTSKDCLPVFIEKANLLKKPVLLEMQAGEDHKTIESTLAQWRALTRKGADRSSLLINLGGGVVTDLGGFVASTFKRGMDFVNVPTSLLAMVDAAVGGKTGIDLDGLKNQIGLIRPARAVFIDPAFLSSLPKREFYSGLAEMLKHGLIASPAHWEAALAFMPGAQEGSRLIWESVQIKKRIADSDPLEKGPRKALNFGHTIGHALETHFLNRTGTERLLHGEAIAAGMIIEAYLSAVILGLDKEQVQAIAAAILPLYPKVHLSQEEVQEVIALLAHDKKTRDAVVYFSLLEDIGKCRIDQVASHELVAEAIRFYLQL